MGSFGEEDGGEVSGGRAEGMAEVRCGDAFGCEFQRESAYATRAKEGRATGPGGFRWFNQCGGI